MLAQDHTSILCTLSLTTEESTVASRTPAQTLVVWTAPVQVATLSEPTVHFAAKESTVAPRTFNTGAAVGMDCATVDVTDAWASGTAGAAVGAGIGAGAGAAMTRVAAAASVRMKEEMHCILIAWLGWSGVWYWWWWPRGMVAQGLRWDALGDRGTGSGSKDADKIEILREYLEGK